MVASIRRLKMRTSIFLITLICLVLSINVFSEDIGDINLPSSDVIKQNDAYIYPYFPYMNYTIYCKTDRIVDIFLKPGEELSYVGGADTVRWVIDQEVSGSKLKQWHVLVKPAQENIKLSTTFVILTNQHAYHIEALISNEKFTPMIAWTYPLEERLTILKNQQEQLNQADESILPIDLNMSEVYISYQIYQKVLFLFNGKPKYKWTPEICFDDGKKTYIKMPDVMTSGDAPALFIFEDGKLVLVNYRIRKCYYIVDRLFDQAEMRNGKQIVKIKRK